MNQVLTLTVINLMFFILLSHPLMLVLLLVTQTLIMISSLVLMQENSWLNYILFLIFLGGLLIIFTYLSAITPNELTKNSMMLITFSLGNLFLMSKISFPQFPMNIQHVTSFNMLFMSNMVPWIIMYLLLGLAVSMYLISFMKTPLKQEIN